MSKRLLMSALLLMPLLAACAAPSPTLKPEPVVIVDGIKIPALPESAKQVDSPDYLRSLTTWREQAQEQLTTPSGGE